ncbi:hypothetical protein OG866_44505 [Streptomyces sp. NBC_00663]|uniref:hypothetical protein n=1 Tax=Streptomyces sp. NBC_00663 TaxID=2975801 RepID=UPI002E30C3E0|nr:hypothetical protein [Streptomyces sp. NBC_00663]
MRPPRLSDTHLLECQRRLDDLVDHPHRPGSTDILRTLHLALEDITGGFDFVPPLPDTDAVLHRRWRGHGGVLWYLDDPLLTAALIKIATLGGLGTAQSVSFAVLLQSLPPCSQVSIPEKALEYYEDSINDNRFELPDAGRDGYGSATPVPYSPIRTVSMAFVDYNGVAWVRTDKGLTASNRPPAIPDGHEGRVVGQPSLESLKSCSDYSS